MFHSYLLAEGVRCWFAPEDLKIGDRFEESIEESIRSYDKVMIVLSEASVKSRPVEREVNAAREREDRENRLILFPVRIDDAVMGHHSRGRPTFAVTRHMAISATGTSIPLIKQPLPGCLRDLKASA
jgi:hypothetical protein